MPMPVNSMVDYKIIQDTYRNMRIEPDSVDPMMTKISMEVCRSEEDRMGWEGFSSDQLPLRGGQI